MKYISGIIVLLMFSCGCYEISQLPGGENMSTEKAIFAAGCFWGVEARFRQINGVSDVTAGYCGGFTEKPTYKDVCSGKTGHAEVVQVSYDPKIVSYEKLLKTFFSMHNPTTLNRQGPDIGTQYRSAVFCTTEEQGRIARNFKEKLENSGKFKGQIVTEIKPAGPFWPAEEYHQRYLEKKGLKQCGL